QLAARSASLDASVYRGSIIVTSFRWRPRLVPMSSCLRTPGELPGPQEVLHRGHHQRVIVRADHLLERCDQIIEGGAEARRRHCAQPAHCPCRYLITFHHGSNGVSSSHAAATLYAPPAPRLGLVPRAGGWYALTHPRASACPSGCGVTTSITVQSAPRDGVRSV